MCWFATIVMPIIHNEHNKSTNSGQKHKVVKVITLNRVAVCLVVTFDACIVKNYRLLNLIIFNK